MTATSFRLRALVATGLALLMGCGSGGSGGGAPPLTWRSALYATSWSPGQADALGRFLHDVSYAGYRLGAALPDVEGLPTVDVVTHHGADPTGVTDATAAFQAAIDAAEAQAPARVRVPAGLFRVDGLLVVETSGVVIQGAGAAASQIYFPRASDMTDRSSLTLRGAPSLGPLLALAEDAMPVATELRLVDASSLTEGQSVVVGQIVSEAFVAEHGMEGVWGPFNGTWQTFERRRVMDIDLGVMPHRVVLDVPLRSRLRTRDGAAVRTLDGLLREVGVLDVGLSNAVAWASAWASDRAHVLALDDVEDAYVARIASFVPPTAPASGPGAEAHLQSGGIILRRCARVTLAQCRMERAQHRGGGGNGYLFELMQCNEVLTRDSVGRAGRHNFIQNWGFGTTGCVWLRCVSTEGLAEVTSALPGIGTVGLSEYHHSLATANLVDGCIADDGWSAANRGTFSSGAGHSATECVFWNHGGTGVLRSRQFGWGYVIGTGEDVRLETTVAGSGGEGSAPEDWIEGVGVAAQLRPVSLYEDQYLRRTGSPPTGP